jgi:hypothetical protein
VSLHHREPRFLEVIHVTAEPDMCGTIAIISRIVHSVRSANEAARVRHTPSRTRQQLGRLRRAQQPVTWSLASWGWVRRVRTLKPSLR